MVLLVNIFVENTVVQTTVEPVVPGIFQNEKHSQLDQHLSDRWEWDGIADTEFLTQWVETPNWDNLNKEVGDEDGLEALPLLLIRRCLLLDLPLLEVWNLVHNEERQGSAEIHGFVGDEEDESRSEQIIAHVVVDRAPKLLNERQVW